MAATKRECPSKVGADRISLDMGRGIEAAMECWTLIRGGMETETETAPQDGGIPAGGKGVRCVISITSFTRGKTGS